MKLGMGEILVVLLIALLVLGPDQLPVYARKLGNALKAFREAASETTEGIRENIIEPLNEAQQPLRDALEPVEEMQQEISQSVKDVEKSLKDVTSPIASKKPEMKETVTGQSEEAAAETVSEAEILKELPDEAAEPENPEKPAQEPADESAENKPAQ